MPRILTAANVFLFSIIIHTTVRAEMEKLDDEVVSIWISCTLPKFIWYVFNINCPINSLNPAVINTVMHKTINEYQPSIGFIVVKNFRIYHLLNKIRYHSQKKKIRIQHLQNKDINGSFLFSCSTEKLEVPIPHIVRHITPCYGNHFLGRR